MTAVAIAATGLIAPPGGAAVVFPDPEKMTWDFTLGKFATSSGDLDQITIQFGTDPVSPDKLGSGESLMVEIFATGQSVPFLSKTINGVAGGLNGYFWISTNLEDSFPDLSGRVELTMLSGSVEIQHMGIIANSPSWRYAATLEGPYHLVPEPSACLLTAASAGFFATRRKRPATI